MGQKARRLPRGEVVDEPGMSLRGFGRKGAPAPGAGHETFFFRGPVELKAYVKQASAAQDQGEGEFIIGAIELDRALGEKLTEEAERIVAFAAAEGLSLDNSMAEVLARLVRIALDHVEKRTKK